MFSPPDSSVLDLLQSLSSSVSGPKRVDSLWRRGEIKYLFLLVLVKRVTMQYQTSFLNLLLDQRPHGRAERKVMGFDGRGGWGL